MNILVINCGSSSLKFQLINMQNENVLAKGIIERIGGSDSYIRYHYMNNDTEIKYEQIKDHNQAMEVVIHHLLDSNVGVIKNINEICAVGHRVVHGGEEFYESVIINERVIKVIEDCVYLAPIHNPPNLSGIIACRKVMPNVPMVAVFDTAFHHTIPKHAFLYALPYDIYEKYRIRKYGFHGTSHKYVFNKAVKALGYDSNNVKAITCHLGNGSSVCAIKNGHSIDTSMGLTPLEGLAMGTRCGNIDPSIVVYLMENEKMSLKEIYDYLNKKSGMLGLSGISNDVRDIKLEADKGNERAKLALEVFTYRIKQYISSYAGVLGGVDVLIFTAGIGENSRYVRAKCVEGLDFLGIGIDNEKNELSGVETDISKEGAKVRTLIIPTNEELMIARETYQLLKSN